MIRSAAVLGCGSIGQRHVRNLRELGIESIVAFDPSAERRDAAVALGARAVSSEEVAVRGADVVLVCTPPHLHNAGIRLALEANAHCFVEKPISHTLEGVDDLARLGEAKRRVVMVGYMLRFEPGLRKMKQMLDDGAIGRLLMVQAEFGQYLPDWRPSQDYRSGYNVRADMGGGIILDASHEIDYVRWLAGEVERVYCVAGTLSDLEMDAEDAAAITLECAGRVIAEIHLDTLQRVYSRRCKLIGTDGVLTWELRGGVQFAGADRSWKSIAPASDPNQMYVDELRHFLAAAADGDTVPDSDVRSAARVLEVVLAARRSAATAAAVTLHGQSSMMRVNP